MCRIVVKQTGAGRSEDWFYIIYRTAGRLLRYNVMTERGTVVCAQHQICKFYCTAHFTSCILLIVDHEITHPPPNQPTSPPPSSNYK